MSYASIPARRKLATSRANDQEVSFENSFVETRSMFFAFVACVRPRVDVLVLVVVLVLVLVVVRRPFFVRFDAFVPIAIAIAFAIAFDVERDVDVVAIVVVFASDE